jgi:hypothetical protein
LAGYRIHLVGGAQRYLTADRCRKIEARYVFERQNTPGNWQVVHEVAVADVTQLQDGVDVGDPHAKP